MCGAYEEVIQKLSVDACYDLHCLHTLGLVHTDTKGDNTLLIPDKEVLQRALEVWQDQHPNEDPVGYEWQQLVVRLLWEERRDNGVWKLHFETSDFGCVSLLVDANNIDS